MRAIYRRHPKTAVGPSTVLCKFDGCLRLLWRVAFYLDGSDAHFSAHLGTRNWFSRDEVRIVIQITGVYGSARGLRAC